MKGYWIQNDSLGSTKHCLQLSIFWTLCPWAGTHKQHYPWALAASRLVIVSPSWTSQKWKMCLVSERGQTWAWKFITCTATRWRQPIHQAKLSPRSQTFPIKSLARSLTLFLDCSHSGSGKSSSQSLCVYRNEAFRSTAVLLFNHLQSSLYALYLSLHWLFLHLSSINTLSAAGRDIKGIVESRGRAFLTLAPSFASRARQWQWKDFTMLHGRNSFCPSSIMLNPLAVPLT